MKTLITALLVCAALGTLAPVMAQTQRQDAIWARTALNSITLDGVLDEPEWALAESWVIEYAVDAGIPGSGWKTESGWQPIDPTYATIKFLVSGNQLYMAAVVEDQHPVVAGEQVEVMGEHDDLLVERGEAFAADQHRQVVIAEGHRADRTSRQVS